jgi:hypothetical protein
MSRAILAINTPYGILPTHTKQSRRRMRRAKAKAAKKVKK